MFLHAILRVALLKIFTVTVSLSKCFVVNEYKKSLKIANSWGQTNIVLGHWLMSFCLNNWNYWGQLSTCQFLQCVSFVSFTDHLTWIGSWLNGSQQLAFNLALFFSQSLLCKHVEFTCSLVGFWRSKMKEKAQLTWARIHTEC